jgi:hypothetical protein
MRKKKINPPQEIYRIKITLLGTDPPIWRLMLVPGHLTLEEFHRVIQTAVGWEDRHLYEFRIDNKRFGDPEPDDLMGVPGPADASAVNLSSVLGGIGAKALYVYDFGDNWEHDIFVEDVVSPEAGQAYPICLDGDRHCPPEDCGGAAEFDIVRRAVVDRYHPQHRELRRWVGRDFDPQAFSAEEVNQRLAVLSS